MANTIVTVKMMPESPDVDLAEITAAAKEVISKNGGTVGKEEIQPIAFGLKAVVLTYVVDESLGGTDSVEAELAKIENVQSVEVTDVRRAIG
ncbi:elongation factor 1-beta [Candidatus Woesearchaeota archaeon]|nr:MAG: elongation factor 1-beta [Candidatus Woesearchaeota archaeon]